MALWPAGRKAESGHAHQAAVSHRDLKGRAVAPSPPEVSHRDLKRGAVAPSRLRRKCGIAPNSQAACRESQVPYVIGILGSSRRQLPVRATISLSTILINGDPTPIKGFGIANPIRGANLPPSLPPSPPPNPSLPPSPSSH
ncbi:hypothetical protein G5714_024661 [Onychostoma macrolepis]|uniref:Uncharacterized protein n=1 Tax=Onychostoma macrolepis TaxID=369639 RepID=A0A7J6BHV3_9TELE|nr:hypothetical protein G5714_024661 [Onychostoma macrolepis]